MAVAPSTSEAAGVTESGNFSQSDADLASQGLACHSTVDGLDLDQLNSLFSKVTYSGLIKTPIDWKALVNFATFPEVRYLVLSHC